jgi:hypothetical protein
MLHLSAGRLRRLAVVAVVVLAARVAVPMALVNLVVMVDCLLHLRLTLLAQRFVMVAERPAL